MQFPQQNKFSVFFADGGGLRPEWNAECFLQPGSEVNSPAGNKFPTTNTAAQLSSKNTTEKLSIINVAFLFLKGPETESCFSIAASRTLYGVSDLLLFRLKLSLAMRVCETNMVKLHFIGVEGSFLRHFGN